ncbi:exodeoxyribonuclease VII small subunit [Halodurantibacterium flavum]|uniref:Exodeoxyribonuclease 7 small subunit n=1 Tax=Halodurantibacterium flavum TaxID=1382802 RepID=A0ABW4S9S5_9RHOB
MTDQKPVADMTFEEAMGELERVVAALEQGNVPLEQSIALYERGATLRKHCEDRLRAAEEKVEAIRLAEGKPAGLAPADGL